MEKQPALCPSFRCAPTAKLLGVRQHGKIAILPNPLEIDSAFVSELKNGTPPEQRFRFVSQCKMNGCKQWSGSACGIAKHVIQYVQSIPDDTIPNCSIREHCRWHQQEGVSICKVCPYIITDLDAEEVHDFFSQQIQRAPTDS